MAYVVGVIRALATWKGPQARVEVDGVVHDTPLMFATVGNGTRSGGLFRLTPTASPFDGLLDVCTVRFVPPGRALLVAPRTVNGSHGRLEDVLLRTGSRVRIDCSAGVPVHADGEIVATACRRLDAWIVAGALPVLVPGPGHHTRSARSRRRVI